MAVDPISPGVSRVMACAIFLRSSGFPLQRSRPNSSRSAAASRQLNGLLSEVGAGGAAFGLLSQLSAGERSSWDYTGPTQAGQGPSIGAMGGRRHTTACCF